MLRITRQADSNGPTILALEGRLTANLVAILEQAVAAAEPEATHCVPEQGVPAAGPPSSRLALDLNDLSYVDQAGIAALRRLLDRGLGIAHSPDWIRLLLAKPPITG
jgi:ABC-type transporter Mla MlaB component